MTKYWINDFSAMDENDRNTVRSEIKAMKREQAYCACRNIPFDKKYHRIMLHGSFNRIKAFDW